MAVAEASRSYCGVLDHDVVLILGLEIGLFLLRRQDVLHLAHHAVYCSVCSRKTTQPIWVLVTSETHHMQQ